MNLLELATVLQTRIAEMAREAKQESHSQFADYLSADSGADIGSLMRLCGESEIHGVEIRRDYINQVDPSRTTVSAEAAEIIWDQIKKGIEKRYADLTSQDGWSDAMSEFLGSPQGEDLWLAIVEEDYAKSALDNAMALTEDKATEIEAKSRVVEQRQRTYDQQSKRLNAILDRLKTRARSGVAMPPKTTGEIADAFVMFPGDEVKNTDWWKRRIANAGRYDLLDCIQQKGGPKRQALLRPDAVAGWLVDKGHMTAKRAAEALRKSFPEYGGAADLIWNP